MCGRARQGSSSMPTRSLGCWTRYLCTAVPPASKAVSKAVSKARKAVRAPCPGTLSRLSVGALLDALPASKASKAVSKASKAVRAPCPGTLSVGALLD
jgi:dihydroxyacetone kinase-like predicted kinase